MYTIVQIKKQWTLFSACSACRPRRYITVESGCMRYRSRCRMKKSAHTLALRKGYCFTRWCSVFAITPTREGGAFIRAVQVNCLRVFKGKLPKQIEQELRFWNIDV